MSGDLGYEKVNILADEFLKNMVPTKYVQWRES